ncbi:hypothetical protein ACLB2K_018740 [Fragaria x ananassa]
MCVVTQRWSLGGRLGVWHQQEVEHAQVAGLQRMVGIEGAAEMCSCPGEDLVALPCALDFQISASMATAEIEGWSKPEVSLPVQRSVFWVAEKAICFSAGEVVSMAFNVRRRKLCCDSGGAVGNEGLSRLESCFLVVLNTGGLCSGKCTQRAMFALMRWQVPCVVKWLQPPSGRMKLRATGCSYIMGFRHDVLSFRRAGGGVLIRRSKLATSFPQSRLPSPLSSAGFRCCCSVSLSQPAASESPPTTVKKRIVSGVQPTGSIHLGNYLGAIRNWITLQNTYDTLFFIVDLHAITLPYDAQQLSKATRDTAALYLACGVDTSKASVFVQSHVHAHVELMWLLSSVAPVGWLNRMIQFKEKSRKAGDENVGVALLTYPVLMASDILLYQSDFVPVGEDQKQHLELTRELADRGNNLFGGRKWKKLGGRGGALFKVPEPLIPPVGARVMSLTDGLSKMSKSAPSDQSRINLLDQKDEVAQECQDMNWGTFKSLLADALIDHLYPIQVRYEEIISDSAYLDGILAEGAMKASDIADTTLNNVYQAMGFLRR